MDVHLTQWENIIFNRSLMNIGNRANEVLKSPNLYGKYKHEAGHWVYWTKIAIKDLPKAHQSNFETKKEK